MKILNLFKLIFIILPIAIAYGLFIAFTTLVEYIIDKAKMK